MYPRQELRDLARLRAARIRSIEQSRGECRAIASRLASPLGLLDWAVAEWRATRGPVRLAMVPVEFFLERLDPSRRQSVRRILQGALFALAIARRLDRVGDEGAAEAGSE